MEINDNHHSIHGYEELAGSRLKSRHSFLDTVEDNKNEHNEKFRMWNTRSTKEKLKESHPKNVR